MPRLRSGLPPYPYLAVTDTELCVLELRYGTTTTRRRVVGRWLLAEVHAVPGDDALSVRLRIDGRDMQLEATTPGPDATEVLRLLTGTSRP